MTKSRPQSLTVRRLLLLLLAVAASAASFLTTVQGTLALFPDFGFSKAAAIGLAIVIQIALLIVPFEFGARSHLPSRAALAILALVAWLLSTTTSFVCIHSAFTKGQSSADRGFAAWQASRDYLDQVHILTLRALEQVDAASAELERKIQQEVDRGGALLQFVNPHLRALVDVEARNLPFDRERVVEGTGLRADFLRDIQTQLVSEKGALEASLRLLSEHRRALNGLQDAQPAQLLTFLNSATESERRLLVSSILPETDFPQIDTRSFQPIETSREWAFSIRRLGELEPTAIGMALIAFALDFFIVVLSWAAGVGDHPPRQSSTPLAHLFHQAYGIDYLDGARRWWEAVEGEIRRHSRTWHVVRTDLLADERDYRAQEMLQRGRILRSLRLDSGDTALVLSERHRRELGDLLLGPAP